MLNRESPISIITISMRALVIGATGATVEGLAVTGEDNFVAGEAGKYKVTITFAWDGLKPSDVKAVFAK